MKHVILSISLLSIMVSSLNAQSDFLSGFDSELTYHHKNVLNFGYGSHSIDPVPHPETGRISLLCSEDGISIIIQPDGTYLAISGTDTRLSGTFNGYIGTKEQSSVIFFCKIDGQYSQIVYRKNIFIKITSYKGGIKETVIYYLTSNI